MTDGPPAQPMRRVDQAARELQWLAARPTDESATGYAAEGWPAETWILHAMYENPSLHHLGTHDELHRRRVAAGEAAPVVIGDVNLDELTTLSGIPLGFVGRPDASWRRVRWSEYLDRTPDFHPNRSVPPCFRWFPHADWPATVAPPPEGSLDEETLTALLDELSAHSPDGAETRCFAFYASLPADDFDSVHLWHGRLCDVPTLLAHRGGPYEYSPTNLWPEDRSWFAWTDYDLMASRVSGSPGLISSLRDTAVLETIDWHAP